MPESTSSLRRAAVYPGVITHQIGQNYGALIFGDVSFSVCGTSRTARQKLRQIGCKCECKGLASTVNGVALPEVAIAQSKSTLIAAVRTTAIDGKNKLVGFQGDFTFDERVVGFESEPVQKAGITGGNWNVSGNVLPGRGPIRTLRVSAYSNDFTPLSGAGTLFELRMTRVSKASKGTQLRWAAPPEQLHLY